MINQSLLLITTGDNYVRQWLEQHCHALIVIDCKDVSKQQVFNLIAENDASILLTYRCPYILPIQCFSRFSNAFNIHPSLLPAYKGLNPWDEMSREKVTKGGVTILRISYKVDEGEIVAQQELRLNFSEGIEPNRMRADLLAASMLEHFLTGPFHKRM